LIDRPVDAKIKQAKGWLGTPPDFFTAPIQETTSERKAVLAYLHDC
jgi:hypothetical protein